MDLIVYPDQHAILTLVEKSTNMLLMQKLPFGKQSKPLAKAVRKLLLPYKDILKTITTDNGPGFAAHKDITKFLGVPVYFADPYCSWQKGAIENYYYPLNFWVRYKFRADTSHEVSALFVIFAFVPKLR